MTTEVYKSKRAFIEGLQAKVGKDKICMNKSIRLPVFGFATEDTVYQANNAVHFVKVFNALFDKVAPVDLKFTRTAGKNTFLVNFLEVEKVVEVVESPIEDLKESLDKVGADIVEASVKPAKPKKAKKPKAK